MSVTVMDITLVVVTSVELAPDRAMAGLEIIPAVALLCEQILNVMLFTAEVKFKVFVTVSATTANRELFNPITACRAVTKSERFAVTLSEQPLLGTDMLAGNVSVFIDLTSKLIEPPLMLVSFVVTLNV